MLKRAGRRTRFIMAASYGFLIGLWLLVALARFLGDGARDEVRLAPDEAGLVNLEALDDGVFVSENTDPQLVFEDVGHSFRLVQLRATFENEPGEMELFYTRKPGEAFSTRSRVIGVPRADGSYLYRLPAGRIHSLRLDLGTAGGSRIEIAELVLNPKLGAGYYFIPSLRDAAALLGLPALALCVIYTIMELWRMLAKWSASARENRTVWN